MSEMKDVPAAYPTLEQGMHSMKHLAGMLLGSEPKSPSLVAAHGWVGVGTGLSLALPLGDQTPMLAKPVELTADEKFGLEAIVACRGDEAAKFDWKAAAKLVLGILLKFLICLAVAALLVLPGEALAKPPQAPTPPQDPFALVSAKKPKKRTCACDCGCEVTGRCGCGVRAPADKKKFKKVCGPDGCKMVPESGAGCGSGSCGSGSCSPARGRFFRRR